MEGGRWRVNVGCGRTPTPGWLNFDSSWSVRFARWRPVWRVLEALHLLDSAQRQFVRLARERGVRYADATRVIPLPDRSVDVLYACHMLEHLDRTEAQRFLQEARRVLGPGGILRIAVPDVARLVERYLATKDADRFIESTFLTVDTPRTAIRRLRALVVGSREQHRWMYDGASLCALLSKHGFSDPRVVPAGTTRIANPDPLDLAERASETVYVEALNP